MKLHDLVERYITFRQALGEKFKTNASFLRAFARAAGTQAEVADVRPELVERFLTSGRPVTHTWFAKHTALLGFYRYAISRGRVDRSPLPVVLPQRPPPFVPYIYSREELRRLLETARARAIKRGFAEPDYLHPVVLLIYATGLRSLEAVRLDWADVDLENLVLTVRHTKFDKSRVLPFSRSLARVLGEYQERAANLIRPQGSPAFFRTRVGTRVRQAWLEKRFRRLCECAGVRRGDEATYQPRLHDLRHTFAVHRLIGWYREGADVQRLLPQLSVYLGHRYLSHTQVYLSMTPELLQEAGARFEDYACGGEGHD